MRIIYALSNTGNDRIRHHLTDLTHETRPVTTNWEFYQQNICSNRKTAIPLHPILINDRLKNGKLLRKYPQMTISFRGNEYICTQESKLAIRYRN